MQTRNSALRRRARATTILVFLGALLQHERAEAQTFPPDATWTTLTRLDAGSGQHLAISDVSGDSLGNASRDLVGNQAAPMAQVHSDATHFYFRLRINATGLQSATNFASSTWGCLINSDQTLSSYEYSVIIDGAAAIDTVRANANTTQGSPNSPSDAPEVQIKTYLGPLAVGQPGFGYARHVSAGTIFPLAPQTPDADFFVDWAVEKSILQPDINDTTVLRFACGTGISGSTISIDFSDAASLPLLWSDPYRCDASGCVPQTCAGFGQACSVGVGSCAMTSTITCNALGQPVCDALPGEPQPEVCDGDDNDCNGIPDDGNPGGGVACSSGLPGVCDEGQTNCIAGALTCTPLITPGTQPEICDALDNDCDSLTDEGFDVGASCTAGVGACAKAGNILCDGNGGAECSATPGTPSPEACNGIDDDCDGFPDDGDPGGGIFCNSGLLGICGAGVTTCSAATIICVATVLPGQEQEICNNQDDDCDGLEDEDLGLGVPCSEGVGACETIGYVACDGMGGVACNAIPGTPSAEICGDPVDSDCDGNPNNGCPDSDGDGLVDAVETQVGTDPQDADSDDDGVLDGEEEDATEDSDGDGLINALDPDSDNDGLADGTEMGKDCSNPATDPAAHHCIADADMGATTTNPLDPDTDDGGVSDGSEDANLNGRIDAGETNPTASNGADDSLNADIDGDGLSNALEATLGTNPIDADSDDDGVLDGDEANPADDTDNDGLINVLDPDSDNDALFDGTEMGKDCSHPDTNTAFGHCRADQDTTFGTSPLDKDTDNGGMRDGSEDFNLSGRQEAGEANPPFGFPADDKSVADSDGDGLSNGLEQQLGSNPFDDDSDDDGVLDGDEANPSDDTDGDGKRNVIDHDSDGDGLFDGTEVGNDCSNPATNPAAGHCKADADMGATKTSMVDKDSDNGGVTDGAEDKNKNGALDPGETDPTQGHGIDDPVDTDGDGLLDKDEIAIGTNPNDADSDDDGVLDSEEPNPAGDADGDGIINGLDHDSDGDGLFDGTEMGKGCAGEGTDPLAGHCIADGDNGQTTTDPLDPDTDNGGVSDGLEDINKNGRIDVGETNPTVGHGDDDPIDSDGDGLWDGQEIAAGTNPNDADSDDDGIADGDEPNWDSDSDGDGLINALDHDSDNDGLADGTEVGNDCSGPGIDPAKKHCVPDADGGQTTTDPLDPDTDDGGVNDGSEDTNLNGQIDAGETDPTAGHGDDDNQVQDSDGDGLSDDLEIAIGSDPNDADSDDDGLLDGQEPNFAGDTDGDGKINLLDEDSDGDGIFDGTEAGLDCSATATDPAANHCLADADMGATVTSPVDPDTDDGGIDDGEEDKNHNGAIDPGETDPTEGHGDDDPKDSDGDGLTDPEEIAIGLNPMDADSDDDGLPDGEEKNPAEDTDNDGTINGLDPDSDNDGLADGTEMGKDCSATGTDIGAGHCIPDADQGATTTDPLDADTDNGGVKDGDEDQNHNGVVDMGETDPQNPADDAKACTSDSDCGDGQSGRICSSEGKCQDGCRGEGGNGCPEGEVCSSTSALPGECKPAGDDGGVYVDGSGLFCSAGANGSGNLSALCAGLLLSALALRRQKRR